MVTTATTRAKAQNTAAPEAEKRVILSMGGKGGVGELCRLPDYAASGLHNPSKPGPIAFSIRHNPVPRAPTIGTYENTPYQL